MSYLLYMKSLGKEATLIAATERKRALFKEHLQTAHKVILH